MNNQPKYDFEYEANGKKTELKNVTLEEINEFIKKLKAEKESGMKFKRVDEER